MSACSILGIGASIVAGADSMAARLATELSAGGRSRVGIFKASSHLLPAARAGKAGGDRDLAAREDPASYDAASFLKEIASERDSGRYDFILLATGPLSSLPEISGACTLGVFIDIEERLMLLRWADALMEAGSPGGIEALGMYSELVEPVYGAWAPKAMASSILVLDVEEGEALLAQKILWLVDKSSVRKPEARADSARIEPAAEASGGERLALIRAMESRYSRPLPAAKSLGPAFRMFMSDTVYPAVKRALDISLVSLLLMVIWPIYALVALLIWLDDPGPVFYSQTRIGKYGKTFPFPKFRSMVRDADKLKDKLLAKNEMTGGITFKMKRDPRIIPIGFVIRKYSLDELPQLWSILKGDLSLVGPRPPVPREVALYTAADRRRLEAVPGLTCIWQVSGRSEIPFPRQVELDVEYLESRSLSLDLRLLLATIPAVLTGKGAY